MTSLFPVSDSSTLAFAEKLFVLLDEGRRTATYKFAVLLGLIDLCLEKTDERGGAPSAVTTAELARKVTALYWPQCAPFELPGGHQALQQNTRGQAEILQLIVRCQQALRHGAGITHGRARAMDPVRVERLEREVEWKLVQMPLPRLQIMGASEVPFIYRIGWTAHSIRRREFTDPARFDNRILLVPGAAEHLIRLAPLVRPLIQRQWALMVAQLNALPQSDLERHLFGARRVSLSEVTEPLRELQERRCLYCAERLGSKVEVDHFIPWSRHPDDGLENLVAAHPACNGHKRDFLASADHVRAWRERNDRCSGQIAEAAAELRWEHAPGRALGTARSIYLRLTQDVRLWRLRREFVPADRVALEEVLRPAA